MFNNKVATLTEASRKKILYGELNDLNIKGFQLKVEDIDKYKVKLSIYVTNHKGDRIFKLESPELYKHESVTFLELANLQTITLESI